MRKNTDFNPTKAELERLILTYSIPDICTMKHIGRAHLKEIMNRLGVQGVGTGGKRHLKIANRKIKKIIREDGIKGDIPATMPKPRFFRDFYAYAKRDKQEFLKMSRHYEEVIRSLV